MRWVFNVKTAKKPIYVICLEMFLTKKTLGCKDV